MAAWPTGLGPLLEEVIKECVSGKQEYDDEHDLQLTANEWLDIIEERVRWARSAPTEQYRHQLVVVAAVCLSALRADRKRAELAEGEHVVHGGEQ